MMLQTTHISLFEIISSLSNAMDLINPALNNHHARVAYISYRMASALSKTEKEIDEIILAGSIHDIGAIRHKERLLTLEFELTDGATHSEAGYLLLKEFEPLSDISRIVRHHHTPWDEGRGQSVNGEEVPFASHILHFADRVSVLVGEQTQVLNQVPFIVQRMRKWSGSAFSPTCLEAFLRLADQEAFWFDTASSSPWIHLPDRLHRPLLRLEYEGFVELARLLSKIIDYRSRFTATHSVGVASAAETMARLSGMNGMECAGMRVAGYLHDLGKLSVPTEILEKPGALTDVERNIVKSHPYHTYQILSRIQGLEIIREWAAYHHETLNGQGYPFRLGSDDLCLGSRIMAVADVFTALREDRPYRAGMSKEETLSILQHMASRSLLDNRVVELLVEEIDQIDTLRMTSQSAQSQGFEVFWEIMGKNAIFSS